MSGDLCTWLYAVTPGVGSTLPGDLLDPGDPDDPDGLGGLSDLRDLRGVAGEHLRLLTGHGLDAVVGSVPGTDFDAPALHRHLQDPDWLERAARAHHHVIDTLARTTRILPLRFATLYRDDRRVLDALDEHRDAFRSAFERIAGCEEWGVKVYLESARLHDPVAAGDPAEAGGTRPGTAYLLRRRAARDRTEQVAGDAAERARQVHGALAATARGAAEHAPQPAEATGIPDPMVLNGAYLVDRGGREEFDRVLAGLRREHAEVLRIELTGPWPPYSFVEPPSPGEERAP